jgi:hypothetical protein
MLKAKISPTPHTCPYQMWKIQVRLSKKEKQGNYFAYFDRDLKKMKSQGDSKE